jgi:murein DD-endopeptidase MepM/ murein hydrolase activator NlpD
MFTSGLQFQAQMAMQHSAEPTARDGSNPVEAARKFEAYLAQIMLREMRKTVPEGGLFSGPAMDTFVDMFDQAVGERIAEGGRLGLSQQLSRAMGHEAGPGGHLPGLPPISGGRGRLLPLGRPEMAPEAPHSHGIKRGRWPVSGAVSSHFGGRSDPFTGEHRHHAGMDIAAPTGTPIMAVEGGEVMLAGHRKGYGNVVMVRHDDGTTGLYAHCHDLGVRKGDRVHAGESIATVGATGRATGPHLHFELRADGKAVNPEAVYQWQ